MRYFELAHENAVMPMRATIGSAGYDLYSVGIKRDRQNNVIIYDTGVKLHSKYSKITAEYLPFMMLCARSSIYKSRFVLANGVGIIDVDYPDTIKLIFKPISEDVSIEDDQPFKIGEKCGQLILMYAERDPEEVLVINTRDGGLGSTDKKPKTRSKKAVAQ